jgi:lipid A 3-O-deacylase
MAVLAAAAAAGPAHAVEEVRVGVMAHNIRVIEPKNANKEAGPNIEGEAVFGSPGFLHWAASPRPYVMASYNTQGETSFAAIGLEWRWRFADGWAFEPGLGYAIHDGKLNDPYPNGTPQAQQYQDEHVLLGSRDLFRTSLVLDKDIGESWGVQVIYEHLSHGQILGHGRNQGLDEAGVRLRYSFGK